MKRNGAFGKEYDAPKAGALAGCATPRLHSFYITSKTGASLCARSFDTDTPAFQAKFRSTVSKPLQIESVVLQTAAQWGGIGRGRWSAPPTIRGHSNERRGSVFLTLLIERVAG